MYLLKSDAIKLKTDFQITAVQGTDTLIGATFLLIREDLSHHFHLQTFGHNCHIIERSSYHF
jgi:hypothetical protein